MRGREARGGGGPEQSFQAIEQELELEEHELLLRVRELEDKLMLRTKQLPSSSDPELDPNQGVLSADGRSDSSEVATYARTTSCGF